MAKRIRLAYKPFPIFVPFHLTREREKAAVGGVGAGKTIMLCADAIDAGLRYPGARILIARKTVPALRDTTEREFVSLISKAPPDFDPSLDETLYNAATIRRAGGHIDTITFHNGSVFHFKSIYDTHSLMGMNLLRVYLDQAEECVEEEWLDLMTRMRQEEPTPEAQVMGVRWDPEVAYHWQQAGLVANPLGKNWLYRRFVENPIDEETGRARYYVKVTPFDNPTLYKKDGSYKPFLAHLLTFPPLYQKRYVFGEHTEFEGAILPFRYETHVYPHFDPPDHWEKSMGFDWGLRAPAAAGWWARDPETGVWYKYREWMSHDPTDPIEAQLAQVKDVVAVAQEIRRLESGDKNIKWRAADPQIASRQAVGGKSLQWWLGQHHLHFQLGLKDYGPRISSLVYLLNPNPAPKLMISDRCVHTAYQYEQYRWSKLNVHRETDAPEKPHKKDDHLVDADEYLATIHVGGFKPIEPDVEEEPFRLTLNKMAEKQVRKTLRGRRARPRQRIR